MKDYYEIDPYQWTLEEKRKTKEFLFNNWMEIFRYVNTYINIYVLHSGLSFFWEKSISSRSVDETPRRFSRNLVFFSVFTGGNSKKLFQ